MGHFFSLILEMFRGPEGWDTRTHTEPQSLGEGLTRGQEDWFWGALKSVVNLVSGQQGESSEP